MYKNKINLSQIENIIDNHIEVETPFLFVCNEDLAYHITKYLLDEYCLFPDDSELYEYDEYYVSFLPGYGEFPDRVFCESARGLSGRYKIDDEFDNNTSYYIFSDMSVKDVYKYLQNGDYGFYEIEDDVEVKCCECKCCEREEISIGELIDYYVEVSQEGCQCSDCMRQLFLEYTNDLLSEIVGIDEGR